MRGGKAESGRTIEQLFEMVQREIDADPDEFQATYGEHGVPKSMSVDREEMAVDDEYGFTVSDFRRLEPPPPPPPPPPPAPPPSALDRARADWTAAGIGRHSLLVTRRCGTRRYVRRDWTVPKLHAFLARRPSAIVLYRRHGIPRAIRTGGCRYVVTRFRRGR